MSTTVKVVISGRPFGEMNDREGQIVREDLGETAEAVCEKMTAELSNDPDWQNWGHGPHIYEFEDESRMFAILKARHFIEYRTGQQA